MGPLMCEDLRSCSFRSLKGTLGFYIRVGIEDYGSYAGAGDVKPVSLQRKPREPAHGLMLSRRRRRDVKGVTTVVGLLSVSLCCRDKAGWYFGSVSQVTATNAGHL